MPSTTRQVAQPVDESVRQAWARRALPERQSTILYDHQGRPFRSTWEGDSAKRPRFSWQVYTTNNVEEDPIDMAEFLGGLEIAEYEASFDIYTPLASTHACIAH